MIKNYNSIGRLCFFLIFIILISTKANAQCTVQAPADVTINCGSNTTLSAATNAVTYSVITSSCPTIPITGTNAFPVTCDDCVTGQIPIGFPFNFYGTIYNSAVIQSNGIVGFGAFTFTGYNSFAIPAAGFPNNYIAGFFADIDIRYGGTISYQTIGVAPNREFIVSYDNVVPYNLGSGAGTGTASFQIIISENGSFRVVIAQLSANWLASTSGSLATSGSENAIGTYAFPVPGRNSTDWPGIVATDLDCHIFNPQPCVFQRWEVGGVTVSTNPNLVVSPTIATTYDAFWNCGGTICSDNTLVSIAGPSITNGAITNNSNCISPNGTIPLSFNGISSGTYTMNYLFNGVAQSQSITIGGVSTVNQGAIFNSGNLSSTDLTWNRNAPGTICTATSGTTYYLDYTTITPSVTGIYTLNMCTPGTNWDGHASLYQNSFIPSNPCNVPTNFIIADDDSNIGGNCENDAVITATLTSGITYYLVTTSFGSLITGNYEWNFTGPVGATINQSNASSFSLNNLNGGSYSNFLINTGTCGGASLVGPINITNPSPPPVTTGTNICAGGTGTITSSTACGTSGTTVLLGGVFNSGSLATTDTTWNRNTGGTFCGATATGSYYYDVASFTVSTTGSYVLDMCTPGVNWDGHASLYQNAFTPTNPCGIPANFIIADDDSNVGANCENDSKITATLTAGITYYLITTSFFTSEVGNYQWTFTNGPAASTINFGASGGILQWFTSASGGSSISSANPFNPVGVVGSGLANTNTPGTYTYYASCSSNTTCRTPTNFIISGKTWLGGTSNWNITSNWSGGILPNSSDCVVIPITPQNPIISGTNYNAFAGTLTVLNGATLTVNSNNSISVTNWVNVQPTGNFNIQNSASLIQVTNTTNTNIGNITMNRNANIRLLDYVYWSSPVINFPVLQISPNTPTSVVWKWNPTINGTDYGIWINANENMVLGKGYILRGPSGHTALASNYTATFSGIPNNGPITTTISRGTRTVSYTSPGGTATADDDNWNLVGNPYPSAIDALTFLSTNTNIEGTVRLWTHGSAISTAYPNPFYQAFVYNYNANDYVNFNSLGSTPPGFLGKIGAGQSFFVSMNHTTATPSTVVFNNNLRSNAYSNSQFYKINNNKSSETTSQEENKSRIWLSILNETNTASTTLVGYIDGATLEKDRLFDGLHIIGNQMGIYSTINNNAMIIQGRPAPFDQNDIVPIGITIPSNGNYKIAINTVDGLFENINQTIYIEDTQLGLIHDLRLLPYSFAAHVGNDSSRFKLRYTNQNLSTNELNSNTIIKVISNENIIINSSLEVIQSVLVFDVLGRKLAEYKSVNSNEIELYNLIKNNTTLILKIQLQSGIIKNEKIIY